jgi:hypothetical protein
VVFVPKASLEKISEAVFDAGAGSMGEYSNCSFSTFGTGTFKGSEKSNPAVGKKNVLEKVEEARFEVFVDSWKLSDVITAMKKAHPYEEVAYDIYPLSNVNVDYGIGAFGELDKSLTQKEFLDHVSKSLRIKNFRFSGKAGMKLTRIAVCGGSGSEYVNDAVKLKCDAYVTADIKYHTFQDSEKQILLVDAGHYETEIISLNEIENRLTKYFRDKSHKVLKYKGSTNPVIFYNK